MKFSEHDLSFLDISLDHSVDTFNYGRYKTKK